MAAQRRQLADTNPVASVVTMKLSPASSARMISPLSLRSSR
jgi:hypothetical protein